MSLSPDDFPAFFEAIHGVAPFPWQTRLLHEVSDTGEWPPVLDLPTGSGKTAALDVAVFHLALEAHKGDARGAAVRIAFVVDRRIIVDDAFARAKRIADKLGDPQGSEVVERVAERLATLSGSRDRRHRTTAGAGDHGAERLATLSGSRDPPLLARRLRGGVPREDDWARTPAQPTILCSTVDQVGSRLLFRGYGVSDRMKPIHAGLLGSDSLILLDEAHLSEPFRQTLGAVAAHATRWRDAQYPYRPLHFALLTATPGNKREVGFGLDPDTDLKDDRLVPRLVATKTAHLMDISGERGQTDQQQRITGLSNAVAHALADLKKQEIPNPAVAVVVNRVARARALFETLRQGHPEVDVGLIIGPSRSLDREASVENLLKPIRTRIWREDEDWRGRLEKPLIVVATQTIEAGVDVDFDGLVTEAASIDALRQRFGRLNRVGRDGLIAYAAVVAHKDDVGRKADDPVYGEAAARTWAQLLDWGGDARCVDFASMPMKERLKDVDDVLPMLAPTSNAPVMMPAYVDLWSQTSPIPAADPDVSLFLHGQKTSLEGVRIVWRADFDDIELKDAAAVLTIAPPAAAETLEVSVSAAKAWLTGSGGEASDVADAPERGDENEPNTKEGRRIFRWAGPDGDRTGVILVGGLRPGDLIVVPATYGGCDDFGWAPESRAVVSDLGADAGAISAGRRAVRVTRALVAQALRHEGLAESTSREAFEAEVDMAAGRVKAALAEQGERDPQTLLRAVADVTPTRLAEQLKGLEGGCRLRAYLDVYGRDDLDRPNGVIFSARLLRKTKRAVPATEDDDLGSADGTGLSLDQHSADVRDMARLFADRSGLNANVAFDVALAAWLHDAGKADERFQTWLYGGSWIAAGGELLAKSIGTLPKGSWGKAGLPDRWRHEALSVRFAREHSRFADAHDPELVLWLIGVHHGYGRPFFPDAAEGELFEAEGVLGGLKAAASPGPQSLAFEFDGFDWPQIFERLKARYGVWELARLEAIVRLADHRASETPGGVK